MKMIEALEKLYPFQSEGVRFLRDRPSAYLADEMGLGKTVQAIMAARLRMMTMEAPVVTVICPASVVRQWRKEIEKWDYENRFKYAVISPGVMFTARTPTI